MTYFAPTLALIDSWIATSTDAAFIARCERLRARVVAFGAALERLPPEQRAGELRAFLGKLSAALDRAETEVN